MLATRGLGVIWTHPNGYVCENLSPQKGPQMLVLLSMNHQVIGVPNFDPYPYRWRKYSTWILYIKIHIHIYIYIFILFYFVHITMTMTFDHIFFVLNMCFVIFMLFWSSQGTPRRISMCGDDESFLPRCGWQMISSHQQTATSSGRLGKTPSPSGSTR